MLLSVFPAFLLSFPPCEEERVLRAEKIVI